MIEFEFSDLNNKVIRCSRQDYVEAKTKDLQDFGYNNLTTQEVDEQLEKVIRKQKLNVIGKFIEGDNPKEIKTNKTRKDRTMAKKKETLKVTRKQAVELLADLGFGNSRKDTNEVLLRRLGKLKRYKDNFKGTLNGAMEELAGDIIKAGVDNIALEGEEPKTKVKGGKKSKTNSKAKKAAGKPKSKSKTKKRIDSICDAIKKIPKSGKTLKQIAEQANQDYMKAGGDDNAKQTLYQLRVVLPTLINFEIVSQEGDKLKPTK